MRYFFCDQSLVTYSGHCFEYFKPLIELVIAEGSQAIVLGNNRLDNRLRDEIGAIPLFTYWCDEQNFGGEDLSADERANKIRAAHEIAIVGNFANVDRQYSFSAKDIIILNSARHWVLRGLFHWISSIPVRRRPKLVLLLHFTAFPVPYVQSVAYRHYREAFELLNTHALEKHVRVLVDSEELVAEYEAISSIPIDLAPIPHAFRANVSRRTLKTGGRINVGYIGEARIHKGFHLLPFLAEHLNVTNVHFHIHSFCFDQNATFLNQALAGLRNAPNVTLYPEQLSSVEYESFLDIIDISLIPYSLENYYRQTSGVYAESVGLAKPVVTSRGTWMANQVGKYGGGELCISNDFLSLTHAVRTVSNDFERYAADAFKAAKEWRAFHNPQTLMNMINIA